MFKNLVISVLASVVTYNSSIWEVKSVWLFVGLVLTYEIAIQCTEWFIEERKEHEKTTNSNADSFNVSALRRYKSRRSA